MKKIKVAIIGFGGIARVHNNSYCKLMSEGFPVELCAVCDRDVSRITAKLDFNLGNNNVPLPEGIHIYSDIDELILKEDFDVADICLPTFLHKEMTVKLLLAGKHVICEKPMALNSSDCEEMAAAAKESQRQLMIAQVLRFDPAYRFLKAAFDSGKYGKLDNIYMDRHSVYPTWGASFANNAVTGGVTLDTHIHDVDVIRFILGEPDRVFASEFNNPPKYQVVTTTLGFGDTTAIINCSWDSAYTTPFTFSYRARFEEASIVCQDGEVIVTRNGCQPKKAELCGADGVTEEIRQFINNVISGAENKLNPPESSLASVKLIEKIRESASKKESIKL